ncbi:Bgt-4666 [Blumeria graminis f. sp. tritici]|uniref:Bgt-4666 n=2 Tax=Blumeria graminis f. sp. tritici TaxID=62690 RepID=A0A9X9L896_BLUGR|nr:GTPase-activating protein (RhoGAP) [Blumeria graminis f. sp. tritici 96224]VCU39576.1 Bgt-4666 [Blumeria graminis f. sp. tritici]
MPTFSDSFWSADYAGGLGVLFEKLQQGVAENQQMLMIARMRAEAEETYGTKLGEIEIAADKISGGFSRDDGASVKKAYDGLRMEMNEASTSHRKIAQSIRDLVVTPFTRWCDSHETRVQSCQDDLQSRIKMHDKQAESVKKLRSQYFTKCRLVEDIEEENKMAFQGETSPKSVPEIKVSEKEDEAVEEPVEIGDEIIQPDQLKKILAHMLTTINLGETKVAILGTYQNTSCGSEIVEYLQKHMAATSISHAERIGQDLITNGFLRLIGNVGNIFANSSKMYYQWKPKAFQWSGVIEKKQQLNRTFTMGSHLDSTDSLVVGTVTEYLAGWNPLSNQYPNETPGDRLRREAAEADIKYKVGVKKLDQLRCKLEEAIFENLRYLERCELDRLRAMKTIILDFSGTIGNVIPSLQASVDKMMLYQETIQPVGDLRYLLENYRTGCFTPKVVVYENYYNSASEQTFGVDLEARARAEKRKVPMIVTTILEFLDHHYPDLEGDEARRNVWLIDVPLHQTHKLRDVLNTGDLVTAENLEPFGIPVIASVLKLYLLELPDSLVSAHVYEVMKTIYSTPASQSANETRISVLQNTLQQLRLSNIATLDLLVLHFTRLLELTSADETYISALATVLAPCVLRPKVETSLTLEEKCSYRLILDLFSHRDSIFLDLKRASYLSSSISLDSRPRAISSDESNRKANMEARARAIIAAGGSSRSRATSPAPARGHRRDRSSAGPETRFPIQTSPTDQRTPRSTARHSLDVPIGFDVLSSGDTIPTPTTATISQSISNGIEIAHTSATYIPGLDDTLDGISVEKRNSLGRSSHNHISGRFSARKPANLARMSISQEHGKRTSLASLNGLSDDYTAPSSRVGINLTDKPMGD